MTIPLDYQKRKNTQLFSKLHSHQGIKLEKLQNYIPIYNHFFALNNTNYNSINLNHTWILADIKDKDSVVSEQSNIYTCKLKNILSEDLTMHQKVFFKMAPLLDPFKYIVGKYNHLDDSLFNLPSLQNTSTVHPKILDKNNSSYIDGFFVFLTSQLLNHHRFIHGIDYYGSFLGMKNEFKLNIIDDLDYLIKSEFFNKHKNLLFQVEDYSHLIMEELAPPLKPIQIHNECKHSISFHSIDDTLFENIFEKDNQLSLEHLQDLSMNLIDITHSNMTEDMTEDMTELQNTLRSSSTCSSRTSHTGNSSEEEGEGEGEEDDESPHSKDTDTDIDNESLTNSGSSVQEDNVSDDSDMEEETLVLTIPQFPVQVICMENCENTLDYLITHSTLSTEEWFSALMQIVMTLLTYQKLFLFTHNDLHTNNVMYNKTNQKYIYYVYKKKYYKVPTFGKIFKIIDFGRSIYKWNNTLFCSDSFQIGGDASTQYNTEPYFNDKKPRLEPNYSFDLCRLACSMFDYVVDDFDNMKQLAETDPVVKIIIEWCLDDNGMNVLYKNNGLERYPDFKLYKMIARHVHQHTPAAQLERPEFKKYIVSKQSVGKEALLINIDDML